MSDDLRFQQKCYYASSHHADSFWGKFIYLYQGKGSLRLTAKTLCLEGCPEAFEIPFQEITAIRLARFSSLAKPYGLRNLEVTFTSDGKSRTVHLVPYQSPLDPTWVTSELVVSWHQTLENVEGLAGRVEPSHLKPESSGAFVTMLLVGATFVIPLAVGLFIHLAR